MASIVAADIVYHSAWATTDRLTAAADWLALGDAAVAGTVAVAAYSQSARAPDLCCPQGLDSKSS